MGYFQIRKFLYAMVFVLFCLSTFVLSVLMTYLVLSFYKQESNNSVEESKTYQYLVYDHSENEISRGITTGVTTCEKIINGGDFFIDENNNGHLISEIGNSEFKCIGICVCEGIGDGSSKRTTNVISRGLYVLVAAVSSSLAYYYASRSVQKECEKDTSFCEDGTSVQSEIEDCEEIPSGSKYDVRIKDSVGGNDDEQTEFMCTGHCLLNPETERYILESNDENYLSTESKTTTTQVAREKCENIKGSGSIKVGTNDENENAMVSIAKNIFVSNILNPLCIIGSRKVRFPGSHGPLPPPDFPLEDSTLEDINDFFQNSFDAREMKRPFLIKKPPVCVASENEYIPLASNPSIECRKM